jgi:hypothetical protein
MNITPQDIFNEILISLVPVVVIIKILKPVNAVAGIGIIYESINFESFRRARDGIIKVGREWCPL